MAAQFLAIDPKYPQKKKIQQAVDVLKRGGVIIYPTDTIYGLGCDLYNARAIDRLCWIKGIKKPEKLRLSFICKDISAISGYVKQIPKTTFKLMKRYFPGPYTFIMEANNEVPKILNEKKKTVGIRIPDHPITSELVNMLGNPIVTSSIKNEDEIREYTTDPEDIYEEYKHLVSLVIDGGTGGNVPSTIIDCRTDDYSVIRQGLGDFSA